MRDPGGHVLVVVRREHDRGALRANVFETNAQLVPGRLVESGPVSRIFNSPTHPYTEALLSSIPRMSDSRKRLTAIEGQPPDLAAMPPGCSFQPRCVRAFDRCREEVPPEFRPGVGQTARCWLADPAAVNGGAPARTAS